MVKKKKKIIALDNDIPSLKSIYSIIIYHKGLMFYYQVELGVTNWPKKKKRK